MEMVYCAEIKCGGKVCWNEEAKAFICDKCGVLYE